MCINLTNEDLGFFINAFLIWSFIGSCLGYFVVNILLSSLIDFIKKKFNNESVHI